MVFADGLFTSLQSTINNFGENIRFRYFTGSIQAGSYDDQIVYYKSGNDFWVSGLVQPIGKGEAYLVQQGKLFTNDMKVYFDSSVPLSGIWRVGIGGSPPANEYAPT